MRARAAIVLLLLLALPGCGGAGAGRPLAVGPPASLPDSRSSHVVIVLMENAEYGDLIGSRSAPYVNGLAQRYGLATASYAITHPSLPNYLALISGSTHGIESDCTSCSVSGASIATELQGAGIGWRAYLEGIPRSCFGGASAGGYAKKHNPFAYFRAIVGDDRLCARLVGFDALATDLRRGTLPTFVWISPNLCDDGHDCATATADRFLARTLPPLIRELGPHGFLVLTWDEGTTDAGCCGAARGGHIATIVAGPDVRRGARSGTPLDHYGVLATIEDALGLARLGGARDPRAGTLAALFARAPRLH